MAGSAPGAPLWRRGTAGCGGGHATVAAAVTRGVGKEAWRRGSGHDGDDGACGGVWWCRLIQISHWLPLGGWCMASGASPRDFGDAGDLRPSSITLS